MDTNLTTRTEILSAAAAHELPGAALEYVSPATVKRLCDLWGCATSSTDWVRMARWIEMVQANVEQFSPHMRTLWARQELLELEWLTEIARARVPLAVCIGCGCDDLNACVAGGTTCHWLHVDYARGLGVCSRCPGHVNRLQAAYIS